MKHWLVSYVAQTAADTSTDRIVVEIDVPLICAIEQALADFYKYRLRMSAKSIRVIGVNAVPAGTFVEFKNSNEKLVGFIQTELDHTSCPSSPSKHGADVPSSPE